MGSPLPGLVVSGEWPRPGALRLMGFLACSVGTLVPGFEANRVDGLAVLGHITLAPAPLSGSPSEPIQTEAVLP